MVQMVVYLIHRSPKSTLDGKVDEEGWIGKCVDYFMLLMRDQSLIQSARREFLVV